MFTTLILNRPEPALVRSEKQKQQDSLRLKKSVHMSV